MKAFHHLRQPAASRSSSLSRSPYRWTAEERETLEPLCTRRALGPSPPIPTNRVCRRSSRPRRSVSALFFDARLSSNGAVSCATCHLPELRLPGREAAGARASAPPTAARCRSRPPPTVPWLFWDGRKDSQWSQALGPLESAASSTAATRAQFAHLVGRALPRPIRGGVRASPRSRRRTGARWTRWRTRWPAPPGSRLDAFRPDEVSRVFANIGKAIAAYERRIGYAPIALRPLRRRSRRHGRAPEGILTHGRDRRAPSLHWRGAMRHTATTGRCSPTTTSTTPACPPALRHARRSRAQRGAELVLGRRIQLPRTATATRPPTSAPSWRSWSPSRTGADARLQDALARETLPSERPTCTPDRSVRWRTSSTTTTVPRPPRPARPKSDRCTSAAANADSWRRTCVP